MKLIFLVFMARVELVLLLSLSHVYLTCFVAKFESRITDVSCCCEKFGRVVCDVDQLMGLN